MSAFISNQGGRQMQATGTGDGTGQQSGKAALEARDGIADIAPAAIAAVPIGLL